MTKTLTLLLALLIAAPASAQYCTVVEGHEGSDAIITRTTHVYACGTDKTGATRVPVSKAWFHAHCHIWSDGTANCDVYAVPRAIPTKEIAQPPHGFWHNVKLTLEYAGAGALVFVIIANGGGGAFQ